jgi:hypothetical protein
LDVERIGIGDWDLESVSNRWEQMQVSFGQLENNAVVYLEKDFQGLKTSIQGESSFETKDGNG